MCFPRRGRGARHCNPHGSDSFSNILVSMLQSERSEDVYPDRIPKTWWQGKSCNSAAHRSVDGAFMRSILQRRSSLAAARSRLCTICDEQAAGAGP